MGQFDGLLPEFEYGSGSPLPTLVFTRPPFVQEIFTQAWTLESWAPEADTGSTTEYVADHIYMFDFVRIQCQGILDSEYTDFETWWNVIRDGQEFTYYPDTDTPGTSYTVVKAMKEFKAVMRDSLWYFDILLRIIA
jgi:hypothetical protein